MKYSLETALIILSLFLVTQLVGLWVNNTYLNSELPYGLQPPKEKEISPWFFVGMIIIASLLFIFMSKLKFELLMKVWFFIAVTSCIAVSLGTILSEWIALIIAAVIAILKFKERDIYTHNLGEILLYGGLVALFAPMLSFWSMILLLVIMSIYDYVAVFITKHMISLAHLQEKLGIFTGLLVINKNEVAILGGGDIAFTLLFAVVVLRTFGMASALLSIFGATLFIAILMIIGKKKKYYPAMPFVTAGSILGLIISMI
ncbi:MAG: hypothetical protein J7K73_02840 [Nanoarchaeota archaeon]|nr:hypothetical protein [Nanoarchaeota archaeon]